MLKESPKCLVEGALFLAISGTRCETITELKHREYAIKSLTPPFSAAHEISYLLTGRVAGSLTWCWSFMDGILLCIFFLRSFIYIVFHRQARNTQKGDVDEPTVYKMILLDEENHAAGTDL